METERQHILFIALNIVGGMAVLGSYAWGFVARPDEVGQLWGGVPAGWRPVYTTFMLLATVGYFFFTAFVLLRIDPTSSGVVGGFALIQGLYAGIFLGSALWMPLTFALLANPSEPLWWLIRGVLALVGLCALGLLATFLASNLDGSHWLYPAAVLGLMAFCFQTAVLDALVWPYYFR